MTSTTADSVLQGYTQMENPDPRISSNWATTPKNFTIFCVRYVNEWHGNYLLRGQDVVKSAADGGTLEIITYHTKYLEGNAIVKLNTSKRYQVTYENAVRRTGGGPGNFQIALDFNSSDITQATLSTTSKYPNLPVAGNVKMVLAPQSNESWGNIKRNTIYLAYTITDGDEIHNVNDTLVFRDKAVAYADFVPSVHAAD